MAEGRLYTKKYSTRKSPPYPANEYCGKVKKGNDNKMYISSMVGKQRSCTWKPLAKKSTKRSPKRS